MAEMEYCDVIVIGAGQAGPPLAQALAAEGQQVVVVERQHVGGTCVNEGCTPTKTMAASARVAYLVGRAEDYGVRTGPVSLSMERVRQRKRDIVESFRSGGESRLRSADGIELVMGEATFVDRRVVQIALADGGSRRIGADRIFINAGARSSIPSLPGLDQVPFLDSTMIMELGEVPRHLLILGGGYVAIEFGQMFRRFGAEVTIVERGAQLLSREDDDVARAIQEILTEDGVQVLLETEASSAAINAHGVIEISVNTPQGESRLEGSHLLIATGRRPNSDTLNLAATGVETDSRGFIPVNDRLETNVLGVYALGDIKGPPFFTHISYDDYRVVVSNLLSEKRATTRDRLVPYTVFMDPQLGRVGLTEKAARAEGRAIRVFSIPMTWVARALEIDESRGLMKAVVDADTDRILGVAVLGVEGGEIMAALQMAMLGQMEYTSLRDGIFAHPTLAEAFNTLFSD
jgi:pyruvate/2-oxoglutarate dehydrogenase complex dihydrolipoamide dehydrogenase (E3) component